MGGKRGHAQLEAARRGSYESRSALAISLSKRWKVEQVAAQKLENHVLSAYVLRVDGVDLGLMRGAVWPEGPDGLKTALLFSLHCDPALPLALAALPLVHHARQTLTSEEIGVQRVMGIAALPGLCQWMVDERAWERVLVETYAPQPSQKEQRDAVEAIANGRFDGAEDPAFDAANGPLKGLALEYAAIEDMDAESTACAAAAFLDFLPARGSTHCSYLLLLLLALGRMSVAGGRLVGIHWMHDKSDEALRAAAGCTASFEFETELIKHVDIDDKLSDHIDHTPHPAEGHPGRW